MTIGLFRASSVLLVMSLGLVAQVARAVPGPGPAIRLPESIYGSSRDLDQDDLQDDLEVRLADVWRPLFEFDENENSLEHGVDDVSLRASEPRILLLVNPVEGAPQIQLVYNYAFRLDGGYRASSFCGLDRKAGHSGDTGTVRITVETEADGPDHGVVWWVVGWKPEGGADKPIKYETPLPFWRADSLRSETFDFEGVDGLRPHPVLFFSGGKHHSYWDDTLCESRDGFKVDGGIGSWLGAAATIIAPGTPVPISSWEGAVIGDLIGDGVGDERCEEDCGGGARRLADLQPLGYFTNVGSSDACQGLVDGERHPRHECNIVGTGGCIDPPQLQSQCQLDGFINQPFTNDLWHLGFPNEQMWDAWYFAVQVEVCANPDIPTTCMVSRAVDYTFLGGANYGPNNTTGALGEPLNPGITEPLY